MQVNGLSILFHCWKNSSYISSSGPRVHYTTHYPAEIQDQEDTINELGQAIQSQNETIQENGETIKTLEETGYSQGQMNELLLSKHDVSSNITELNKWEWNNVFLF